MLLQGNSPYYLLKEIGKQERIEDLYPLSRKIPGIIPACSKRGPGRATSPA